MADELETEMPWTETDTLDLAEAILSSNAEAVTSWLAEHITTPQREYTILAALPVWCALLVRQFMPDPGTDGCWALEATRPDPDPKAIGVTQMVVAALNDDEDALLGHVDALFERDHLYRAGALFQLAAAFRDFGRIAREHREAGGSDG